MVFATPLDQACGTDPTWFCRRVFDWTDDERLTGIIAGVDLFSVLLIIVGAFIANSLVRRLIKRALVRIGSRSERRRWWRKGDGAQPSAAGEERLRQQQRVEALVTVLQGFTSAVITVIAGFLILDKFGMNLAPLLAGAGVVGIALGFGAQSMVRDLLAGILILIEDHYGVGDVIIVDQDVTGTVEAMTLRTTRLRAVDGTVWHVPNGEIRLVGNQSQHWSRALLDIEVAYDTELDRAKEVIQQVASSLAEVEPDILGEPKVWGVESLGASGIVIRLVVKTTPSEQWRISRELRERIKDAFDAEGIEIPFPQQTTWIRHSPEDA